MRPKISAIICTYGRADLVGRAIDSLADQTLGRDAYEIIVVDNGGEDTTRRLVEEKCLAVANLRYFREPELGLSNARNAGMAGSNSDIFAFLDDDAIACRGWLAGIVSAFDAVSPSPGLVCGPVEPIWGAPRPAWLKDEYLGVYSVLNWSQTARSLRPGEWIAGANFAVARDVIRSCGPFDPRLGRKGASLLCGEDTALSRRIREAGYLLYFDPSLVVQHYIHPERLSKPWYYRRVFWGGASAGITDRRAAGGAFRSTRYTYGRMKQICRRLLVMGGSAADADARLRSTRDMAGDLGRLYGYWFLASRGGSKP